MARQTPTSRGYRDIQAAEAEQRQADEATKAASQQTGAQANREAEAG